MGKLWGARFKGKTDKLADQFTFSIDYDQRLALYDVIGSMAHAQMLGKQGIIPKTDAVKIIAGLKKIFAQIQSGTFKYDPKAEDIHTDIQNRLKAAIGTPADKLHTARSRNDQVVLDMRLYCMDHISQIVPLIINAQKAIVSAAKKFEDVIIPGYTHLQQAQVTLLAHHWLAYVEMLERDKGRLIDAFKRMDESPLGSCAMTGTSLRTDRAYVAKLLGLSRVAANSMDAVSSRDFLMETVNAIAILGVHLSRVAEDLILWSSKEFDFVSLDMAYCTGSSIMPHKKNPDVLELIRGTSAQLIGHSTGLMTLVKGLPLTYNRDLQLDKTFVFDAVEPAELMLKLLARIFDTVAVKKERLAGKVVDESFFCVDVMDYLIKKGVSYRDAHDILGKMVKECLDKGKNISDLSLAELKGYARQFEADVKKLFNPQMSVKIKNSSGSTNPGLVHQQLAAWSKKLHA